MDRASIHNVQSGGSNESEELKLLFTLYLLLFTSMRFIYTKSSSNYLYEDIKMLLNETSLITTSTLLDTSKRVRNDNSNPDNCHDVTNNSNVGLWC